MVHMRALYTHTLHGRLRALYRRYLADSSGARPTLMYALHPKPAGLIKSIPYSETNLSQQVLVSFDTFSKSIKHWLSQVYAVTTNDP